ncbi:putative transcription factor & chromatin remodeling ARID family [Helianthus anomalus]
MLDDREYVFKYKVDLQKKFKEKVRWFLYVCMGITSRPIPPYSPNGGYRDVTTDNTWPIIEKDLGFEYQDGDYMRIIYSMYLDVLEYYYKFKSVQEDVHVKEMVNDDAESSGGCHRKTKSAENATDDDHDNGDTKQFSQFARKGCEDDWNVHKKRKRFNFDHMKKVVDDAKLECHATRL